MRKENREIKGYGEIIDVLKNVNTLRIGINGEKYPYVVPVSFGYETDGEKLYLYFHGANEGMKYEHILKNPHVCAEGDIFYRYKKTSRSVTCLYESVIAFGKCEIVNGKEAMKGLTAILSHCGYGEVRVNENALPAVAVYRIAVESVAAKERNKTN